MRRQALRDQDFEKFVASHSHLLPVDMPFINSPVGVPLQLQTHNNRDWMILRIQIRPDILLKPRPEHPIHTLINRFISVREELFFQGASHHPIIHEADALLIHLQLYRNDMKNFLGLIEAVEQRLQAHRDLPRSSHNSTQS